MPAEGTEAASGDAAEDDEASPEEDQVATLPALSNLSPVLHTGKESCFENSNMQTLVTIGMCILQRGAL